MTQDTPKTDKPVTKPEEITKTKKDEPLPDEALEKVIGGEVTMGQRGSNTGR